MCCCPLHTVIEIRLLVLKIFNRVWNKRIIKSVCINSNVFECSTFSQIVTSNGNWSVTCGSAIIVFAFI